MQGRFWNLTLGVKAPCRGWGEVNFEMFSNSNHLSWVPGRPTPGSALEAEVAPPQTRRRGRAEVWAHRSLCACVHIALILRVMYRNPMLCCN